MKNTLLFLLFWSLNFLFAIPLCSQEPFVCEGDFYIALGSNNSNSTVYEVSIDDITSEVLFDPLTVGTSGADLNAMGYRSTDNFIYAIDPFNFELYRIGADGLAVSLGFLSGLNFSLVFIAGDITPDGQYLVIIGSNANQDRQMAFIDLTSPTYEVTTMPITGLTANSADIAFDPITNILYGFDSINRRLVIYDINTGAISSSFTGTLNAQLMGGIFFDAFGNLYGYGQQTGFNSQSTFFTIDKETGTVTPAANGPSANRNDGCSCPYNIGLREWASILEAVPCTEIPFILEIANASGETWSDLVLEQTFSDDLMITGIQNPLGGTITSGGLGSHFFIIENLSLPPGITTIIITIETTINAEGIKEGQAILSGLPEILGEVAISDNPATITEEDPALTNIIPLAIDFSMVNTFFCEGETITLSPALLGVDYLWTDGSTEPVFTISEEGNYGVTVTSACDVVEESIRAEQIDIQVDLPECLEIELGDSVQLRPAIFPAISNLHFTWASDREQPFCITCQEPYVRPFFDGWYFFEVANNAGCEAMDSVLVKVNKNRAIYFPNAFSPNNDGRNDFFFPQSQNDLEVIFLRIFDRWGNLLFEGNDFFTNDRIKGWDGKYTGKALNPGVFVYMARVKYLDGVEMMFSGDVTVVKN